MDNDNCEEQQRLARNFDTLPRELVDLVAATLTEVPWPEGEAETFARRPIPLHVDLIKANNPMLKKAVKESLSKKIFISFKVWKCDSTPTVKIETPFLLPRIMTDQDYQDLQDLSDFPPSTIDINIHLGRYCEPTHQVYNTVFVLDVLTTFLFDSFATAATEDFLDLILPLMLVRESCIVNLFGHPNIRDSAAWVQKRLLVYPTNTQEVLRNEVQWDLIEQISEHGLFMHQFWPDIVHSVIEESFERCLACDLDLHERDYVTSKPLEEPLRPDIERMLRMRLGACNLYFRGLMDCLEKADSVRLSTQFINSGTDMIEYCRVPGRRSPYGLKPNDLAMCFWIVDDSCTQISRIPHCHGQLLHLIYVAVQYRAFVLVKLAQTSAKNPNLHHHQPLKVGDIWFEDENRDAISNANELMEPEDFLDAAEDDFLWLRDNRHFSNQDAEDDTKWMNRFVQALAEYTETIQQ